MRLLYLCGCHPDEIIIEEDVASGLPKLRPAVDLFKTSSQAAS